MTVEEQERTNAVAETPSKPPVPYHLTWEVVTPAGFHLRIERDTHGRELKDVIREFDQNLQALNLKAPEAIKIEIPTAAQTANATASGEAVWLPSGGEGPPKCSLHQVAGVWREGKDKNGKDYAFYSCPQKNADGSYCNPKGAWK